MTRRKKTKSAASENSTSTSTCGSTAPATTLCITAKATTAVVSQGNNQTSQNSPPSRQAIHISESPSASSSIPLSSVSSSVDSDVSSTRNLYKTSKNPQQKKKPANIKVTYVTEQTNIYPNYPVLTVERLPNLDYHINKLTESIGRRPRVYQQGKGVRFVSESNEEYRTIQRYLAKIESEEKIAWCSHTVPAGSSLKVNVKVRKVEVLKVQEDLKKLYLNNNNKSTISQPNDLLPKEIKLSYNDSSLKYEKPMTKDYAPTKNELCSKDSSPENPKPTSRKFQPKTNKLPIKDLPSDDNKLSTPDLNLKESKQGELLSNGPGLRASNIKEDNKKKKLRDIAQNRSFKKGTSFNS